MPRETVIDLYRFLRRSIPALNAAIWTWVRLSAAQLSFRIVNRDGKPVESPELDSIVESLKRRLYDNPYQKFGGIEALLVEFFNTLFTCGSVCGELLLSPDVRSVSRFYFIDPGTIRFKLLRTGEWDMVQRIDDTDIDLSASSTYFYGLDANSVEPWGHSLLASVPFASRVEQALISDMHRSMHNAGYHRIHVKVKPPERLGGEDHKAYIDRANGYFDQTVRMMQSFDPDDNPVTWDDVEIDYIGPASKVSSSSSWYMNHRAMIEEICVGTHLAPFMIGYSYGSTHTWAEFNFELMQRQLRTIQQAATRFLEWITSVEFALNGLDYHCEWEFINEIDVGKLDKHRADGLRVENILRQMDAGIIDLDTARKEIRRESV